MGTLNPNDDWPSGVRHFEANAVLTGGPDCPDNLPVQDVADRTLFQRLRNVTPWNAVLAYPLHAYVQHAGKTWKSIAVNANVAPGTDATKWARWGFTPDELSQYLQSTEFTRSLDVNGYQKLPGAMILQWGVALAGATGKDWTNSFPIAFPKACWHVLAVHIGTQYDVNLIVSKDIPVTRTTFALRSDYPHNEVHCSFIAVGH